MVFPAYVQRILEVQQGFCRAGKEDEKCAGLDAEASVRVATPTCAQYLDTQPEAEAACYEVAISPSPGSAGGAVCMAYLAPMLPVVLGLWSTSRLMTSLSEDR